MKQLGFFFDARRCNGCKTCVVACKDAHNLPVGRNFRHVLEVTDGKWSKDPKSGAWKQNVYAYYLSIACNHCSDPACVKVCPTKAIHKEPKYGAVINDPAKCIGCGLCQKACPWHVPQYFEDLSKTPMGAKNHPHMTKCDMCVDRLDAGLKPACGASCPARALEFLSAEEVKRRHPNATRTAPGCDRGKAEMTNPNIVFNPKRVKV